MIPPQTRNPVQDPREDFDFKEVIPAFQILVGLPSESVSRSGFPGPSLQLAFASFRVFGGSSVLGSHAARFYPMGPRLDIQVWVNMLIWLPSFCLY